MSNEEAIKHFKIMKSVYLPDTKSQIAFDMAISALEEIDRIKAERDAAVEQLHRNLVACNYCKSIEENQYPYDCKDYGICKEGRGEKDCWEWKGVQNG